MKSTFLLLICLVCSSLMFGADTNISGLTGGGRAAVNKPIVKVGTVPAIKLGRDMTPTPTEIAQIQEHIADLKKIDQPDFGLSPTMTGSAFAPIASSGHFDAGLLVNHQFKTSDDVRALVALGPKALPFLLAALGDNDPTQFTIRPMFGNGFGGLFLSDELPGNPANSIEQNAVANLPKHDEVEQPINAYTVKVGDVCFAIVGQIVGRNYLAVRYRPTAIVIINTPVHNQAFAEQVRSIWSSTNAAQRLLDSLLFDYSTEGVSNGESLNGTSIASHLQTCAAMRLLYYFPKESDEMVASRLARLDVTGTGDNITNYMERELTNRVNTEDFIKAVSWSDAPAVRSEILNIFQRTTDPDLLLAALPGIDSSKTNLIRGRLEVFIGHLPASENGPDGEGYNLLVALGERLGEQAKPIFVEYLQNASLQRWRTMSQVLRQTESQWAVELLAPALTDRRDFGWDYPLVPGQNEPRRPIRVCDEAAETISMSRPDLKFVMAGEHANLDQQIALMRERIQHGK